MKKKVGLRLFQVQISEIYEVQTYSTCCCNLNSAPMQQVLKATLTSIPSFCVLPVLKFKTVY